MVGPPPATKAGATGAWTGWAGGPLQSGPRPTERAEEGPDAYPAEATPIGQDTPVPPSPQYPFGFFARYCWWYGSA